MAVFLATTALNGYWKENEHILFLGKWCLLYRNRAHWQKLDYDIMPYPLEDRRRYYEACCYADGSYERILLQLVDILNCIHGVKKGLRYWRVVIGPWLSEYIQVLYERYLCIEYAFEHYDNLNTFRLDTDSYQTPKDMDDFSGLRYDDLFCLQLYSQIMESLGMDFPVKSPDMAVSEDVSCENLSGDGFGRKLRRWVWSCLRRAMDTFSHNSEVILVNPYLTSFATAAIVLKSKFRIGYFDLPTLPNGRVSCDPAIRSYLKNLDTTDDFEDLLRQTLPTNIPSQYIENYSRTVGFVKANFPKSPKRIVSSVGYHATEAFKCWAAESMCAGTQLVGSQHGGSYGTAKIMPVETHETEIVDKYLSWGWSDTERPKIKAMPASKLIRLPRHLNNPEIQKLLWTATGVPRYLYRLNHGVSGPFFEKYIDFQVRFLEATWPDLTPFLRMRLYPHEYGWNLWDRLPAAFPGLKFDDPGESFLSSLKSARIFIVDHNSTTFLEGLALGIPTIAFWDTEYNEIREDAAAYYEELRSVNILHDTPEAAAQHLEKVYDKPLEWWDSLEVMEVRKRFTRRFAWRDKNWLRMWMKELLD